MYCQQAKTFYYRYKYFLSDHYRNKEHGKWCSEQIETVDKKTGEIQEKPLCVFKPENTGENMSMDDKAIGHAGFTVLSNNDSRKIALMIEITRAEEVEKALEKLGSHKHKIKNISMDMNSTYAMVFNDLVPRAVQVIDKFHVMKCVYQAVRDVRSGSVKELQQQLSRGRNRTDDDRKLLVEIEHLRRVSHAVTQSSDKWNEEMTETINQIFTKHDDLKIAYEIAQKFKRWYDYKNRMQLREKITENLHG